jgi:hypothetical protein
MCVGEEVALHVHVRLYVCVFYIAIVGIRNRIAIWLKGDYV